MTMAEHSPIEAPTEARLFGLAIFGRIDAIEHLPQSDVSALDQAGAGASDVLRGAGLDPAEAALRRAFAAGMIAGASELSDAVRLGMLRGLLAVA